VCRHSGEHWEEFYEALFGYEAKLDARARWGHSERSRSRPKFAGWRDPVVAWIDAKNQARREQKEKARLQAIEERGLEAQGMNLVTARRKAHRAAEAMVTVAAEFKQVERQRGDTIAVNFVLARAMHDAATNPEEVLVDRERGLIRDRARGPLHLILG